MRVMRRGFTQRHFFANRKSGTGFTLIETMIVVAITLFLSGMLLTYTRSSDNQVVLAAEQARVAGVLFRAKSFALQRNIRIGDVTACGFGVRLEKPRTLILFQNLPPKGQTDCDTFAYDEGELIEQLTLNPRIGILAFYGAGGGAVSGNTFDVVFDSPYLETHNPGAVTLGLVGAGGQRMVVISEGGGISAP